MNLKMRTFFLYPARRKLSFSYSPLFENKIPLPYICPFLTDNHPRNHTDLPYSYKYIRLDYSLHNVKRYPKPANKLS